MSQRLYQSGASERTRGFSLIELTMVMAIIGVMAAIAAPRYGNALARYRADLAAQRIVADLALAQRTARLTSATCAVSFDIGNHSYTIAGVPDLKRPNVDFTLDLRTDPYRASLVEVEFNSQANVVSFNGLGVPDSPGTIIVQAGGIQKTIVLSAGVGTASVK